MANYRLLSLILLATLALGPVSAEKKVIPATEVSDDAVQTLISKPQPKGEFYELVHDNLRPDTDEFYVSSIFSIKGHPRALIKRSINKRAGDLYVNNIEYGIGDKLAAGYVIKEINFRAKEVIVQEEATGELYGLTVSYGDAKSRLVKKTPKL